MNQNYISKKTPVPPYKSPDFLYIAEQQRKMEREAYDIGYHEGWKRGAFWVSVGFLLLAITLYCAVHSY